MGDSLNEIRRLDMVMETKVTLNEMLLEVRKASVVYLSVSVNELDTIKDENYFE